MMESPLQTPGYRRHHTHACSFLTCPSTQDWNCPGVGVGRPSAVTLPAYKSHWRYNECAEPCALLPSCPTPGKASARPLGASSLSGLVGGDHRGDWNLQTADPLLKLGTKGTSPATAPWPRCPQREVFIGSERGLKGTQIYPPNCRIWI